jgi:hypothetical protein
MGDNVDLATYGGLSMAIVALIGAVKKLFPAWVADKEPMMALALSFFIGVSAKLAGMFGGPNDFKGWVSHVIILVIVSAGSGILHDTVVNRVMTNKGLPK